MQRRTTRHALDHLFLVLAAVLLITSGGIPQTSNETASEASDLVVMDSGARIQGTIMQHKQEAITIQTREPRSTFDVALDDIYSINGFNVGKLRDMADWIRTTGRRIEIQTDRPFSSFPELRISQGIDIPSDERRSPFSRLFGAAQTEATLLRTLNVADMDGLDKMDELFRTSLRLHPDQARLVLRLTRNRSGGATYDGSLSYRERYRIAHYCAHIWLRQTILPSAWLRDEQKQAPETRNVRYALTEGAANVLTLAVLLQDYGTSIRQPVATNLLLHPEVHLTEDAGNRLPDLLRERLDWTTHLGTRLAWCIVQGGGWGALEDTLNQKIHSSDFLDQNLRSFLEGNARQTTLRIPSLSDLRDNWTPAANGSLGPHFLKWMIRHMDVAGDPLPSWLSGYRADDVRAFTSPGGDQPLIGWVTHWSNTDTASSFYRLLRSYFEELPWSVTPGWNGTNHRFFTRQSTRVSVDRRKKNVYLIIAPTPSAHNQLFDRMSEFNVDTRSLSSPIQTGSAASLIDRWQKNEHPWRDLSTAGEETKPSFRRNGRALTMTNPFLRIHLPSFWIAERGPFSASQSLLIVRPRGRENAEIRLNVLELNRSLKPDFLSLLRQRALRRPRYHQDVRPARLPKMLTDAFKKKSGPHPLSEYHFTVQNPMGAERHVREVIVQREQRAVTFQLHTRDEPETLLKRQLYNVIRRTKYSE